METFCSATHIATIDIANGRVGNVLFNVPSHATIVNRLAMRSLDDFIVLHSTLVAALGESCPRPTRTIIANTTTADLDNFEKDRVIHVYHLVNYTRRRIGLAVELGRYEMV